MDKKLIASQTSTPRVIPLVAATLLMFATSFSAFAQEEVPQSWVPEVLEMPEDIEVLSDHQVGSSLRMFSFSTSADVDDLLDKWEDDLDLGGYTMLAAQIDTLDRVIEFSGQGISNAKIAVTPSQVEGRYVIEMDATLM